METNDESQQPDSVAASSGDEKSDEDELDSDSSSSSSESEADDVKVAELAKRKVIFEDGASSNKYMCRTSQLLHVVSGFDSKKFKCGRKLSQNFVEVSNDKASLPLGCLQCFPKS